MRIAKEIALRVRALFRRPTVERELDEEIRHHLELETEKRRSEGVPAEEAKRLAALAFGSIDATKEAHRDGRGTRWLENVLADVRFALRTFRRNPMLAAAGVVTLALGVGANTAIFSVVNAVILRPLPFPDADRLVMLTEQNPEKGWVQATAAPANYLDWREGVPGFEGTAAYTDGRGRVTLTQNGPPLLLRYTNVTGNFFDVLGVRVALGRGFDDRETWANGAHVVLISHRLWVTQFGGDPGIIGRTAYFDEQPTEIVGVMPEGFAYPRGEIDLWSPMEWKSADRSEVWFRRAHWVRVVARLRPGITFQQADAQLQTVVRRLQVEYPLTNKVMGASMTPLQDFLVGTLRRPLLILLGAVALLLLIACANVGGLLLVQALGREREAALRLALGAERSRLVQQALTESLMLSLLGGAAGLLLGLAGTRALAALQPANMLPVENVGVDWAVLAYVLAITTGSGLLFGAAPAIWRGRRAPGDILKEGGRSGSEGGRIQRWGGALVIAEVALAVLLTTGAGLLVKSFWRLQQVDPGFNPRGVLTVGIALPEARYDDSTKVAAFFGELLDRVRQLHGVTNAADVLMPSLSGTGWTSDFHIAGRPPDEYGSEVAHRIAGPDYFRVMGVPLKAGRVFTTADRVGSPPVVIINEALAREFFSGEDPVGQRMSFDKFPDSTSIWYDIIGVVGSEHQRTLAEQPQIEAFVPFAQQTNSYMTLVVRTGGDPAALEPAIRKVVAELDPNLAIASMDTMDALWARSLADRRFIMLLLITFAGVGLILAVVGVYGVMAQLARRRTREMGIRIALGAQAGHVQWLVVRHGLKLVVAGLLFGTVGALGATRTMRALLFDVGPGDPSTFLTVPVALAITALAASWLPAARASRTDPANTLRAD